MSCTLSKAFIMPECKPAINNGPKKLYFKPEGAIIIDGNRIHILNPDGWLYTDKKLQDQYCQFKNVDFANVEKQEYKETIQEAFTAKWPNES